MVAANYMYIDETNVLTRCFVKSTSSIGCVGTESNAPIDSNAGEPTRPCISGIDYFGTEDASSVESSTIDPSRSSCAATILPQEQQCTGDCCSACRIALEMYQSV